MDWGPQGLPFEREQDGGGAYRKEREPSEDIGVCGVKVVHEAFETRDEENGSVADDEDKDLYSCPFCALDFDNSIDARSHK